MENCVSNSYDGEFKFDEFNGRGTFGNEYGDFYEGEFRHGVKHGEGTFTSANEEPCKGIWWYDTLLIKL